MKSFEPIAYALLRIFAGFLFACHGAQKFGLLDKPMVSGAQMILAAVIELGGGALIALGLFTRWAAFLSSGLMAVAYWTAHGPRSILPLQNGGELAVLYCFVFLFLFAHGSGALSLDSARLKHEP